MSHRKIIAKLFNQYIQLFKYLNSFITLVISARMIVALTHSSVCGMPLLPTMALIDRD